MTRADLLRHALRSDESIERELLEELLMHGLCSEPSSVTATVQDGVVTLSGNVDRVSTALIAAEIAGGLDGVTAVTNDITWTADNKR